MNIDPQMVLMLVGGIMLALGLKELAQQRRITPAVKARLLLALIFAAVLIWNKLHLP